METHIKSSWVIVLIFLFLSFPTRAQDFYSQENRLWEPVPDKVYLQETGQKIPWDKPVSSIAVFNSKCYLVVEGSIHMLSGESVQPMMSAPAQVNHLKSLNEMLWALSSKGLFCLQDSEWEKTDDRVFVDICMHLGVLYAATREEVYRLEDDQLINIKRDVGIEFRLDLTECRDSRHIGLEGQAAQRLNAVPNDRQQASFLQRFHQQSGYHKEPSACRHKSH